MRRTLPKQKSGDVYEISEDGQVLYVYRLDGERIDVDLAGISNENGDLPEILENFSPPESKNGAIEACSHETAVLDQLEEWLPQVEEVVSELRGSTNGREDIDQTKINTVIALARCRWTGESQNEVWRRPDTCNINTYYQKWRKDPLFLSVLNRVYDIISAHKLESEVYSISEARQIISAAAPKAARKHVELIDNPNPFVALQASGKVLSMMEKAEGGGDKSINITIRPERLAILAKTANNELEIWEQQLLSDGQ